MPPTTLHRCKACFKPLEISHQLESGQVSEALGYYQQGLAISQKLAAADPSDAQAQRDLLISHLKLGQVYRSAKQYTPSVASFEVALKIAGRLKAERKLPGDIDRLIVDLESERNQSEIAPAALGDWKTLLEQPLNVLPVLLDMRGTQFVQDGRVADAIQAVAKLRELGTATEGQLYNAACTYSLCAAGIEAEKDELTVGQAVERQKHIADALATIREAIKAGWKNFAHMQKDPDLTVLRDLPEFKELLGE